MQLIAKFNRLKFAQYVNVSTSNPPDRPLVLTGGAQLLCDIHFKAYYIIFFRFSAFSLIYVIRVFVFFLFVCLLFYK